jgi:hypothetical protein
MGIRSYIENELASKQGYVSFFKALVAMASLYMASSISMISIALPVEQEAYKHKYVVEHEIKKEIDFANLKCSFEMKSYQDCKLAIYKYELSTSSLDLLTTFHWLVKWLAFTFAVLSLIGFVLHAYRSEGQKKNC